MLIKPVVVVVGQVIQFIGWWKGVCGVNITTKALYEREKLLVAANSLHKPLNCYIHSPVWLSAAAAAAAL